MGVRIKSQQMQLPGGIHSQLVGVPGNVGVGFPPETWVVVTMLGLVGVGWPQTPLVTTRVVMEVRMLVSVSVTGTTVWMVRVVVKVEVLMLVRVS